MRAKFQIEGTSDFSVFASFFPGEHDVNIPLLLSLAIDAHHLYSQTQPQVARVCEEKENVFKRLAPREWVFGRLLFVWFQSQVGT